MLRVSPRVLIPKLTSLYPNGGVIAQWQTKLLLEPFAFLRPSTATFLFFCSLPTMDPPLLKVRSDCSDFFARLRFDLVLQGPDRFAVGRVRVLPFSPLTLFSCYLNKGLSFGVDERRLSCAPSASIAVPFKGFFRSLLSSVPLPPLLPLPPCGVHFTSWKSDDAGRCKKTRLNRIS